jgi:hypothetical protein
MRKIDDGIFDYTAVSFVDSNWSTMLIIVALLLLSINAVLYRRKFALSLQCLFSKRAFSQLSKEGKYFSEGSFMLSWPFVLIVLSLCIKQLCSYYFPDINQQLNYLQFMGVACAGIIVLFILKQILDFFLFGLFDCPEERYNFHLVGFSFILNSSLILFLCGIIVQYTNLHGFYLFSLLIISILFAIKIYKDFIFKSRRVNLFQFFTYFCTLEILPCVLIVKLLFLLGNKGF